MSEYLTFGVNENLTALREKLVKAHFFLKGGGEGYKSWAGFLKDVASDIKAALIEVTPIGNRKGSGRASRSWKGPKKTTTWGTAGTRTGRWVIYNTATNRNNGFSYPVVLEEGSEYGESPWPHARERTVLDKGRVWSSQAVGGIYEQIAYDELLNKKVGSLMDRLF